MFGPQKVLTEMFETERFERNFLNETLFCLEGLGFRVGVVSFGALGWHRDLPNTNM